MRNVVTVMASLLMLCLVSDADEKPDKHATGSFKHSCLCHFKQRIAGCYHLVVTIDSTLPAVSREAILTNLTTTLELTSSFQPGTNDDTIMVNVSHLRVSSQTQRLRLVTVVHQCLGLVQAT